MSKGDEPFQWDSLVPRIVHPTKVAIVEAMRYLDRPLSASELNRLIGEKGSAGVAHISYHVVSLASAGALTRVRQRKVRGAVETFYFFPR